MCEGSYCVTEYTFEEDKYLKENYSNRSVCLLERRFGKIPGNFFNELARIRRVEFHTEVESMNVRSRISFMNLQLLAELFALIEPLLKCVHIYIYICGDNYDV